MLNFSQKLTSLAIVSYRPVLIAQTKCKGTKKGAIPSGNCDVITKTKGIVLKFKIKRQNKTSLSEKKWNTNMENQELPAQAEDEEAAQSASEEMVIQEPGEPRPEQSHLNTFR